MAEDQPIRYAPWQSDIEFGFFGQLAALKIDKDKLESPMRKVLGLYKIEQGEKPINSMKMQIHSQAMTAVDVPRAMFRAEGWIKNYNTIEEFKSCDRKQIIEICGKTIHDAIKDKTIYSCPSLLNSFTAIFFANLKKFHFNYWFAFPTLNSSLGWKMSAPSKLQPRETKALVAVYQSWYYKTNPRQTGFFLLKRCPENIPKGSDASASSEATGGGPENQEWVVDSIDAYDRGFFNKVAKENKFFAFVDPSTYSDYPGIMLRNYLHLISELWKETDVNILCYRETHENRDVPHSIVLKVHREASSNEILQSPKIIGWEKDRQDRTAPRFMDLSAIMDPNRLADQAVDLNLKLIKWRIAPTINLDVIKSTSCLLLGSGTLGSYVSRILMAWGVRKITFVDNATVSYSNPVRQPLFTHHDASHSGTQKAEAAAKALKEVFPGVEARGEVMSVPMLGHPPLDPEKAKKDLIKLEKLIEEHDAIFLLMDTRESRWLPTVIGKAKNKIVLNAALGFESYVIMRHGMEKTKPEDIELGCYFCNDVVAPANSTKDATLDQQCTVTRAGIAPIASALLVELFVSILQHPSKGRAPASTTSSSSTSNPSNAPSEADSTGFVHPLGVVPHTIRGFLSNFSNMQIVGSPYNNCSACSPTILSKYREDDWEFVRKALMEKGYVEEISGLAEVQRKAEEMSLQVDWEEDDEGGDDEFEEV